ncbi:sensor histidine kinase [Saccharicrinis sp. FJH54]|uniref:sensor histidine kinase n=1 Tax=Saccharicrinis sp. FJH54 TaxID=3344665 RepID=UPI0035D43962
MKRSTLIILIVIMSLALPGIIIIQIIWINNAVKLRKEEYRTKVINALTSSSERIENKSYMNYFVKNEIPVPPPPPPPTQEIEVKLPRNITIPQLDTAELKKFKMNIVTSGHAKGKQFTFKNNNVVISTGHDSSSNRDYTVKIVNSDTTIVFTGSDDNRDVIIQRIQDKEKRIHWIGEKLQTEVTILEKELPLDFDAIKEVVDDELKNSHIDLPYNLAVIDSGKITESDKAVTDTLDFRENSYQAMLFPNDIIIKDLFVAIKFEGENRYFLKSVNWLMFASLLFTILILTAFILSIYSILLQKKISEVKTDFINNMTHEFKTPIATIAVAADTLVNKKVLGNPEAVAEYAGLIKQENKRMNGHVEKILSVARMERKEVEFRFKPVDLHEVLEDICTKFALKLEGRNGSIECSLKAANPVVLADYEHIYNSITNLVDNAEKYTPHQPEIRIATSGSANGVYISVTDNGIGLSKQMQHRIFETFYRIPTGNVHNVKGFGIGLSYVKAVCEAHKGTVSVESEPGKGSTFRMFLPYAK